MEIINFITPETVKKDLNNTRQVSEIQKVINNLISKNKKVQKLEEELKEAKEKLKEISEEDLPALFSEHDIESWQIKNGPLVKLETKYTFSLPSVITKPKKRAKALNWIENNIESDIIKRTISIEYGIDEASRKEANKLIANLTKNGCSFNDKPNVNPQTLKKCLIEKLEKGDDVPMELFNGYEINQVIIK